MQYLTLWEGIACALSVLFIFFWWAYPFQKRLSDSEKEIDRLDKECEELRLICEQQGKTLFNILENNTNKSDETFIEPPLHNMYDNHQISKELLESQGKNKKVKLKQSPYISVM